MISDVATELNQDAAGPGRIVTPCPISDPHTPLSAALSGHEARSTATQFLLTGRQQSFLADKTALWMAQ